MPSEHQAPRTQKYSVILLILALAILCIGVFLRPKLLTQTSLATLGIELADTSAGVTVRSVRPNSPAALAGLLPGDIVRKADQAKPSSSIETADLLAHSGPSVHLILERNGAQFGVQVTP